MRVRVASNLEQLLAAVVELGARIAEPGGFTRGAVPSGKLDLLRAEALLEVIHASSERAWRLAQANLGGWLGDDDVPGRAMWSGRRDPSRPGARPDRSRG